jgi:hypothetical protein
MRACVAPYCLYNLMLLLIYGMMTQVYGMMGLRTSEQCSIVENAVPELSSLIE